MSFSNDIKNELLRLDVELADNLIKAGYNVNLKHRDH